MRPFYSPQRQMLKNNHQVRIIGGKWRGRCLHFPEEPSLRPTPNRVRETVFNWLSPWIIGARCLDLFAGSGALGFEALSRGASHVVMIDHSPVVIRQLRKNATVLQADIHSLGIYQATVPQEIKLLKNETFNIVFLDPPFYQNYLTTCWQWLSQHACLAKNAWIYLEAESELMKNLPIPPNWFIKHSKQAGSVSYHLISYGLP